jgi:ribonuclease-3 family protein
LTIEDEVELTNFNPAGNIKVNAKLNRYYFHLLRWQAMMNSGFFDFPQVNPDELSPAVWAYVGDAVYELFIRNYLVLGGPNKTQTLHKQAVTMVRASFQANLAAQLEPFLKETEADILRRGRNVKSGHVPVSSDPITYRRSTAFEALVGYLYLSGQTGRMVELLRQAIELNGGNTDVKS